MDELEQLVAATEDFRQRHLANLDFVTCVELHNSEDWSYAEYSGSLKQPPWYYFKRQVLYIDESGTDPFACLLFYGWNLEDGNSFSGIEGHSYIHQSGVITHEAFEETSL